MEMRSERKPLQVLPPPPLTAEELDRLYDELNRTRFGGTLPKYEVSWNEPGGGLIASTHPWLPSIYISPLMTCSKSSEKIRQILLHEMCHVDTRGPNNQEMEIGHGLRWLSSMIRLADQGEDWVLKDIQNSVRMDVAQHLIDDMAKEMCSIDHNLPWGEVRNCLVNKFGSEGREALSGRHGLQEFWLQIRRVGIDESVT